MRDFEKLCKELKTNPYQFIRDFIISEIEKREIRKNINILKKTNPDYFLKSRKKQKD